MFENACSLEIGWFFSKEAEIAGFAEIIEEKWMPKRYPNPADNTSHFDEDFNTLIQIHSLDRKRQLKPIICLKTIYISALKSRIYLIQFKKSNKKFKLRLIIHETRI